jgi:hypothetical protein
VSRDALYSALLRLDSAIAGALEVTPDTLDEWRELARVALRLAVGDEDTLYREFNLVSFRTSRLKVRGERLPPDAERFEKGRGQAIAKLRAAVDLTEARLQALVDEEPATPRPVALGDLHPWVAKAAGAVWASGYRKSAVRDAAIAVEVELRRKIGATGGTGHGLVAGAFGTADPTPQQPRLRFAGYQRGTDAWTNAHVGAGSFGQGCMMRIRNLVIHDDEDWPEPELFDALAALSLLARWIDAAHVEFA